MRLAVLGIVTGVMIFCVVGLATVLTLAAVVSGMGDVVAGVVLRYVGLGIGVILAVDTVILLLWLAFLTATTELAVNQALATKKDGENQTELPPAGAEERAWDLLSSKESSKPTADQFPSKVKWDAEHR